jgi:hypothetical protein
VCAHPIVSPSSTTISPPVRIRRHTAAYVGIRQHASAYVIMRQHNYLLYWYKIASPSSISISPPEALERKAAVLRQHTSAYVSIRQHTSAYVSICQHTSPEALERKTAVLANLSPTETVFSPTNVYLQRSFCYSIYSLFWYKITSTDADVLTNLSLLKLHVRPPICTSAAQLLYSIYSLSMFSLS